MDVSNMDLIRDGCTIVSKVVSVSACDLIGREIDAAYSSQPDAAIESGRSRVGGRNLMSLWSGWRQITDVPLVVQLVRDHVGPAAGLVRALYFDKPPGQSWSLPLHRDQTIAVAEHHEPALPFSKPTCKAGVPHVEATEELLSEMLTLRLHLDPMCDENGPLSVVRGSHQDVRQTSEAPITAIQCEAGDLFVMRPLLLHGSSAASAETSLHRRVVHLEIAPRQELPHPYQWHQFESLARS